MYFKIRPSLPAAAPVLKVQLQENNAPATWPFEYGREYPGRIVPQKVKALYCNQNSGFLFFQNPERIHNRRP
jgi:hypothetical protein